jgi:hypothetical protein
MTALSINTYRTEGRKINLDKLVLVAKRFDNSIKAKSEKKTGSNNKTKY